MSYGICREYPFAEDINRLKGVKGDYRMYLMGIDKFKELVNMGSPFGFNLRIGAKEVDIYNRGARYIFNVRIP